MNIKMSWCEIAPPENTTQFNWFELPFTDIHTVTEKYSYSNIIWNNGKRKTEHFIEANSLILDFDGEGLTLDEAKQEFSKYQNICIVTSKSHQSHNKVNEDGSLDKQIEPADRFHVIIGLARAISDVSIYKKRIKNLINKYGADTACSDGGRFYFPSQNQVVWYSDDAPTLSSGMEGEKNG